MGCLFVILAAITPRGALIILWLFTDYISRAFDTFLVPLLGLIFLPFTTIMYVLVYSPVTGLTMWDWVWLGIAVILDLTSYGGSVYTNKDKLSGGSKDNNSKPVAEAKEEAVEAEVEEEKEEE